jgi:hypothetical protein
LKKVKKILLPKLLAGVFAKKQLLKSDILTNLVWGTSSKWSQIMGLAFFLFIESDLLTESFRLIELTRLGASELAAAAIADSSSFR